MPSNCFHGKPPAPWAWASCLSFPPPAEPVGETRSSWVQLGPGSRPHWRQKPAGPGPGGQGVGELLGVMAQGLPSAKSPASVLPRKSCCWAHTGSRGAKLPGPPHLASSFCWHPSQGTMAASTGEWNAISSSEKQTHPALPSWKLEAGSWVTSETPWVWMLPSDNHLPASHLPGGTYCPASSWEMVGVLPGFKGEGHNPVTSPALRLEFQRPSFPWKNLWVDILCLFRDADSINSNDRWPLPRARLVLDSAAEINWFHPMVLQVEKWKWTCSVMSDSATPWTVAYQAPPSMRFSRQEYWSGWPFPSPGDLPNPGIELGSPSLQTDTFPSEPPGKPSGKHGTKDSTWF